MKIGEVAKHLEMPASTIRYYEKMGLIAHQSRVSGIRSFDNRALLSLRFIQLAQTAGFTIVEIKSLLENYNDDPSETGLWKPFAEIKQVGIRAQIKALKKMDRVLTELIKCTCSTFVDCVELADSDQRLNTSREGNATNS